MKLTYKLFILACVATIITGSVLAYLSFSYVKSSVEQSIETQQLQLAQQIMDKVDRVLHERFNDIQTIAGDETIEDFLLEASRSKRIVSQKSEFPPDFVRRVKELAQVTGPWDDIDVISMDGIIQYSIDEEAIGKNIKDESQSVLFFNKTFQKNAIYSDAMLDETTGIPTMLFAVPIHADTLASKPVVGAVIAHLHWSAVSEVVESLKGPTVDL